MILLNVVFKWKTNVQNSRCCWRSHFPPLSSAYKINQSDGSHSQTEPWRCLPFCRRQRSKADTVLTERKLCALCLARELVWTRIWVTCSFVGFQWAIALFGHCKANSVMSKVTHGSPRGPCVQPGIMGKQCGHHQDKGVSRSQFLSFLRKMKRCFC